MERKHFIVHGRVQGVGFRFFATSIATKYKLTGYVKNLYDGTVEMEAQGTPQQLTLFIKEISQGNRFVRVDYIDSSSREIDGKETSFRPRY